MHLLAFDAARGVDGTDHAQEKRSILNLAPHLNKGAELGIGNAWLELGWHVVDPLAHDEFRPLGLTECDIFGGMLSHV